MIGDQKYEVSVTFTFEAPVFEEDPTDLFELAELEEMSIVTGLDGLFDEFTLDKIQVTALARS